MTAQEKLNLERRKYMSNFQIKVEAIKTRNGIKVFGCQQKDLIDFTKKEVKKLNQRGLISNEMYHKEIMMREN